MVDDGGDPASTQQTLGATAIAARLAIIGMVVLCFVGAFAYASGWLSPERTTQGRIMAAFAALNGIHPGFRRAHAKGICTAGCFDSNGNAAFLSKAALFALGRVPVVGRLAFASGMPFVTDTLSGVRSLALRFLPLGGEEWRTGMIDIPVFPFESAQAFYAQLLASNLDPRTGKPNPAQMRAFAAGHPDFVAALALIGKRSVSSGFADDTFNSLNTFHFVNAAGVSTPVRWSAVPVQPFVAVGGGATSEDKNAVFDALITGGAASGSVATRSHGRAAGRPD